MKKSRRILLSILLIMLAFSFIACQKEKVTIFSGKYVYSKKTESADEWIFKKSNYERIFWKNGSKIKIENGEVKVGKENKKLTTIIKKIKTYDKIKDKWTEKDKLEIKKEFKLKIEKDGSLKITGKNSKSITYKKTKGIEILLTVIGGLGLFLLGMHNLSSGLQTVAGDRLKWLIGKVTNNRIFAAGIGTLVTVLIQSSSITTVMVVGFVNARLMNLTQAIGVIMGANIGTTITGWILTVKIGKYGLPMLGIAAMFVLFAKRDKIKYIATTLMGLGMIFFGLELMKNGFKPIRSIPEFISVFQMFEATSYLGVLKCILAGAVLTMIVQSSSATLGITIGLAATGVIPFETAAALVLGENIGTTITAFLASFGATTTAKRAAYAHIVFNVLGVFWISLLFTPYLHFIAQLIGKAGENSIAVINASVAENGLMISAAIATIHTGFNIANTLLFLPFVKVLANLLEKIVPEKAEVEETVKTYTQLDKRMLDTPVMAVEQAEKEIENMGYQSVEIFNILKESLEKSYEKENKVLRQVFEIEEDMDNIQKEISEFLIEVLGMETAHAIAYEAKMYMNLADEYESISDYITTILKLNLKLKDNKTELSENKKADLFKLHLMVLEYLKYINDSFINKGEKTDTIEYALNKNAEITKLFKELRANHLERIGKSKIDPLLSTAYIDMLSSYRRIKDHIFHIAESLEESK